MAERQREGVLVAPSRLEHELDVGPVELRQGAQEGVGLEHEAGERPLAEEGVLQDVPGPARGRGQGDAVGGRVLHHHLHQDGQMVLQVGPDRGQVMLDLDPQGVQRLAVADA